jgi:hypothetical protein
MLSPDMLLTTIAVSLAPFWFDLLSKFVSFRGSGSPHLPSPTRSIAVDPQTPAPYRSAASGSFLTHCGMMRAHSRNVCFSTPLQDGSPTRVQTARQL